MAENENVPSVEETLARLAALVEAGDRWLSVDAAAAYLAQMPRKTFLEFAAKPDFPSPVRIGKRRGWKRSELDEWAKKLRDRQQRQKAA